MPRLSHLFALVALAAGLSLIGCGESPRAGDVHPEVQAATDSSSAKLVNCCTRPSCNVCVEKFGKCTCLEDLKAGKAICGDCIEGYRQGKGKLKLIAIPELKKREGT